MNFNLSEENDARLELAEASLIKTIVQVVTEELPNADETTIIIAINGVVFQCIKRICEAHQKATEMVVNLRDNYLEDSGLDLLEELGQVRGKKPGMRPV